MVCSSSGLPDLANPKKTGFPLKPEFSDTLEVKYLRQAYPKKLLALLSYLLVFNLMTTALRQEDNARTLMFAS